MRYCIVNIARKEVIRPETCGSPAHLFEFEQTYGKAIAPCQRLWHVISNLAKGPWKGQEVGLVCEDGVWMPGKHSMYYPWEMVKEFKDVTEAGMQDLPAVAPTPCFPEKDRFVLKLAN